MFVIEAKSSPRGAWKRLKYFQPTTFEVAEQFAEEMNEHGCGPARVVELKTK